MRFQSTCLIFFATKAIKIWIKFSLNFLLRLFLTHLLILQYCRTVEVLQIFSRVSESCVSSSSSEWKVEQHEFERQLEVLARKRRCDPANELNEKQNKLSKWLRNYNFKWIQFVLAMATRDFEQTPNIDPL